MYYVELELGRTIPVTGVLNGGGADLILTKAWRRYHQCHQCELSSLVIKLPAMTAMGRTIGEWG